MVLLVPSPTQLTNLTASMRFEGSLNVDLNEITTNLVPFPRLHFLTTSLAPMFALADLQVRTECVVLRLVLRLVCACVSVCLYVCV